MKKTILGLMLLMILSGQQVLHAAPERMAIKDAAKAAKQNDSRAALKKIDVNDIEDPAARKAIAEILNYLDLPSKK